MLVKFTQTGHYNENLYSKYIFRVVKIIRGYNSADIMLIVLPFKTSDWKDIIPQGYYMANQLNPKKLISLDMDYVEVILDNEVPIDIMRNFKLDSILD